MRSTLGAGFIFWGLFVVFALLVLLYILWMWWVEKDAARRSPPESGHGEDVPGPAAVEADS